MNHKVINALLLLAVAAGASVSICGQKAASSGKVAQPLRVSNIRNTNVVDGCGCYFQFPSEWEKKAFDKNIFMESIDGAPVVAQANGECSAELFENAEQSFRRRIFGSEMLYAAERRLSEVVRVCKGTSGGLQAEGNLRVVHEELAAHNLAIAHFYLSKSYHGKGGKAGARSRLEAIVAKYRHYSRLDEVLLLLGRLYMTEGRQVEAATLFRKLTTTYPGSQYSAEASLRLLEIDALKIDPAPKP